MNAELTKSPSNKDYGLIERNGKIVCDSLNIAKIFRKRHTDVLRDIGKIIDEFSKVSQRNFASSNFILETYKTRGKSYPKYFLTRDGFTKLVFGYNGIKAIEYQIAYINLFNEMERRLIRIDTERQTAEWQQARVQGKEIRKEETDSIQELIEYARTQGSEHADVLYTTYSKLVKSLVGYDSRDSCTSDMLIQVMLFERTLFGIISEEMVAGTHYKEIYRKAKAELTRLKLYWSRPLLSVAT